MKAINIITLALIIITVLFYKYIPLYYRELLYGISLSIKNVILMILPFIIFSFLLNVIVSLRSKAIKLFLIFLVTVVTSNLIAAVLAYYIGINFVGRIESITMLDSAQALQPLWQLYVPQLLSPQNAIILSVIIGITIAVFLKNKAIIINKTLYNISDFILNRIIMPAIPLFVTGFVIKLCHDKLLQPIYDQYLYIFLLIVGSGIAYISLLYLLLTGKRFFQTVGNMLPPLVTAFSTMSSAITLPTLIVATEKNTKSNHTVNSILPPAVNFHVIGDSFTITICFIAVMFTFTSQVVPFSQFLLYLGYFLYFRFSTLGIPGGGIIVLSPVLATYFGFSPEMITLITTLYIVFDPLNTVMNIYGNGAFAIFFSKLYKK